MGDGNAGDYLDELAVGARLAVEIGTEMQLEIDGVSSRIRSQLIGMEPNEYMIVKTPTLSQFGGISVKLYSGNRVVVRYVFGGSVYGFETSIIESISSPYRLLFLKTPKVVSERNIRANRRMNTTLPGRVIAGDSVIEGTITDISIEGCRFEARRNKDAAAPLEELGTAIDIALQLPGVSGELSLKGIIRNVRKDGDSLELGLAFSGLDENAQLSIDSYVKLSQ